MNEIMLFHLWRRVLVPITKEVINPDFDPDEPDETVPQYIEEKIGERVTYELQETITVLEDAQEACAGSNGELIYTFSQGWYGENG